MSISWIKCEINLITHGMVNVSNVILTLPTAKYTQLILPYIYGGFTIKQYNSNKVHVTFF